MSDVDNVLIRSGCSERHSSFRFPMSKCSEWTSRYHRMKDILGSGGTYFFLGKRGRGKTQMATTIAGYQFNKYKKSLMYLKAFEVFKGVIKGFSDSSFSTSFNNQILNSDILIIDALENRRRPRSIRYW